MSILSAPHFHDETEAVKFLEGIIWANGIVCPKCGSKAEHYQIKGQRPGLRCCKSCRKQFTVKVGTVFEDSHVPLRKWLMAAYLLASSKKGMSSHQIHRALGVTYKTAWFMTHRLREAMKPGGSLPPLGGEGKTVEADETYIGNKGKHKPGARGWSHKEKVFSLVERKGKVSSHHVERVNAKTLRPIMQEQIAAETRLITDEARQYISLGKDFAEHHSVNHSIGEYVRGDIHSNTVENYFSIFKRGMTGIYQHCSADHLKRYLAEFDFRYNTREGLEFNDRLRTENLLAGIVGKRLTYRRIDLKEKII